MTESEIEYLPTEITEEEQKEISDQIEDMVCIDYEIVEE